MPASDRVSDVHPSSRPDDSLKRAFSISALSEPAGAFTGDFYITLEMRGALWFAVGDFAGHGLAAAVSMALIQEEFEAAVRDCDRSDPAEVVATMDRNVREEIPSNRFATLVVGRALPDGSLQLVNAGHCAPIVVKSDGTQRSIHSNGPVVGLLPLPACWSQYDLQLEQGDRLIVYTDGVVEATDQRGEEFGLSRLSSLITASPFNTLPESVVSAVDCFAEGERVDDVTVFVLQKN